MTLKVKALSTKQGDQIKHLGVDAGGTFTDFVFVNSDGEIKTHKVLSTPSDPAQAILQGITELGLQDALKAKKLTIVHGSTVATNAALERKFARTAYITNTGFKDVLTIGRQNRKELYNLKPIASAPPVRSEYCFEVNCRRDAQGQVLIALKDLEIEHLVSKLKNAQIEAVAINLLFSFINDSEEKRLEEALKDKFVVSRSSFVLPVYKEYERGIATWLNAALSPKVEQYLTSLDAQLNGCKASIMQSSGGLLPIKEAKHRAVNLLLSGPAGGLSAIQLLGKTISEPKILSFDMGGTSTDVSLMDNSFSLTDEGKICDWPVAVPMLDMDTIGAGGGSIAWGDDAGMLHVGPESAGSKPGPACYGLGGEQATVTDANLVLGRLPVNAKLGGSLALDVQAAKKAIERLADQLGLAALEAAQGIIALAEQQMAAALHNISIKKGHMPSDFVLSCFGGAGGMHVCALADQLEISSALIPKNAGVLSAFGMLTAPPMRTSKRSLIKPYNDLKADEITIAFEHMLDEIYNDSPELRTTGKVSKSLDLRYLGQSYSIEVPFNAQSAENFTAAHKQRYGHSLPKEIELVHLTLKVEGESAIDTLQTLPSKETCAAHSVTGNHKPQSHNPAIFARDSLQEGEIIEGPAIITETISTTWLPRGWRCSVDSYGNLTLQRIIAPKLTI